MRQSTAWEHFTHSISARPALVWGIAFAATGLVEWGDLQINAEMLFAPLFIAPIAFGGWYGGRRLANLLAAFAASAFLWTGLAAHSGRPAALHARRCGFLRTRCERQGSESGCLGG